MDYMTVHIKYVFYFQGFKHFDFVPLSFICPGEFQDFCSKFILLCGLFAYTSAFASPNYDIIIFGSISIMISFV